MTAYSKSSQRGSIEPFARLPRFALSASLTPGAKALYWHLADMASSSGSCYPGQAYLGRQLGVSSRTVRRWLVQLVRAGLVTVERTGRSSIHRIVGLAAQARQLAGSFFGGADRTPKAPQSGQPCPTNDAPTELNHSNDDPPCVLDSAREKSLRYRAENGDGWALSVLRRLKLLP